MFRIIVLLVIFFFVLPKDVHAYIDPGSGSYLFQILIGSILAGIFIFKNNLKKILNLFTKKKNNSDKIEDDQEKID